MAIQITPKDTETNETTTPETTIDNKLELLKYASEVQSSIKDTITSDFILTKLTREQDKTMIIEMTQTAYYTKRLLDDYKRRKTTWDWNKEKQNWKKRTLNENEHKRITILQKGMFEAYAIRMYMLVLLNRNVQQNTLLQLIAGTTEETTTEEEQKTATDKLKALIQNEKEK